MLLVGIGQICPIPTSLFLLSGVTKRQEGYLVFFYLVLLLLGYFCYLSGKSFVACFKVEYLSWIVVYPFFYRLYLRFGELCKVSSFGYKSSYLSVNSFVCSTFPRTVWVTVIYLCSLSFAVYGFLYTLAV